MMKFKDILREYYVNEISDLKSYLLQTDEQKADDLAHNFGFLFNEFAKESEDEIPKQLLDPDEFNERIESYPETYKAFGKWLLDKIDELARDNPTEVPSWVYMSYVRDIKNQWLIHFTDNAWAIANSGFTMGFDDYTRLGLTSWFTDEAKKYGGYDFAFAADRSFDKDKYGKQFVIFRASGIEVYHNGDEEYQTIFFGKTATNIVPVSQGEKNEYAIKDVHSERVVVEFDDPDEAIKWVQLNYLNYHKIISCS